MTYTMKILWRLVLPIAIGIYALPAGGQTRFLFRDTLPDYSRYKTVDDCLAADDRLRRSATLARPFWVDTMMVLEIDEVDSPDIVAAVNMCIAKFRSDSVDVSEYEDWVRLYLFARRDADADVVARRRLEEASRVTDDSSNRRSTILLELAKIYAGARPTRWDRAREFLEEIEREDGVHWSTLFPAYGLRFKAELRSLDTTAAERAGQRIIELSKTLTDEEVASPAYKVKVLPMVMGVLQYFDRLALMDSLRRSSAAYVALKTKHWKQARGNGNGDLPNFLGKQAPALTGDFWFAPSPQSMTQNVSEEIRVTGASVPPIAPMTRPTPGKVSLVVFLYGGCRDESRAFATALTGMLKRENYKHSCWGTYSGIRRLVQQYPALEVTIVSQTAGYVAETQPLSPEAEAQILRAWWLDFHRLPATLVITNTSHFRLSPPDGRRIDEPTANAIGYLFGGGQLVGNGTAYLVDTDGVILTSGTLGWGTGLEKEIRELLEVVMNRP